MAESQGLRPPARSSNGRGQGTGPDTKVTLFTSVRTLSHAIEVDYFNLGVPLDLFVCVGLNDVMQGRSPLDIICDLTMLQEALPLQSAPSRCKPNSVVSKMTSHGDPANFRNKLDEMIELNRRIMQFN